MKEVDLEGEIIDDEPDFETIKKNELQKKIRDMNSSKQKYVATQKQSQISQMQFEKSSINILGDEPSSIKSSKTKNAMTN